MSMSELQCLIYVSTAAHSLGARDVAAILEKSTQMNQHDGVHGMLLLSDGNFMQCIEGDVSGVERTYARILASPLHHRVIELLRGPVTRRQFTGWNWAFQLGAKREFSTPGIRQFLESNLQEHLGAGAEKTPEETVLRTFWDTTAKPYHAW